MKNTEIINFVWDMLSAQGERSESINGCRYRMYARGDTLRCGVGWLIPDELYSQKMEGAALDFEGCNLHSNQQKLIYDALIEAGIRHDQMRLLYEIQVIHDSYGLESWDDEFSKLLKEYHGS